MSKAARNKDEGDGLPRPVTIARSKQVIWIASVAILFVVVFCAAFVVLYTRNKRTAMAHDAVDSGRPLPAAELVDDSKELLADSELKSGKIILVFITSDCDACRKESEFLKGVVSKRADIRFYGVISFGEMESSLRDAKPKFPFKVFYDRGFRLASELGIKRVPIKIFVDNGIVKKSWGGATIDEKAQRDFVRWLTEV